MNSLIRVENIGKKYTIQHQPRENNQARGGNARAGWGQKIADQLCGKKPGSSTHEEFWALKDINFEVKEGERIGIIGRNGAGKSTLLKILSRITEPTTGRIKIKGRVASLLEAGTGFHPELTGRENIFLNGTLLGMSRRKIQAVFAEIVAFAEIEKFLDTPVKHYSTGMYTRLAFSVATHLDSEILLLDEILGGGDILFQRKCFENLNKTAKNGRTIFLISHNMGTIHHLADRVIYIEQGLIKKDSTPAESVRCYLNKNDNHAELKPDLFSGELKSSLCFNEIFINHSKNHRDFLISPKEKIKIDISGECYAELENLHIEFSLFKDEVRILTQRDTPDPGTLSKGKFVSHYELPEFFLRPGEYSIAIGAVQHHGWFHHWIWGPNLVNFTVLEEFSEIFNIENFGIINLTTCGTRTLREGDQG